ncbi:MAG: enoyl-CoA hydratase [Betaproteobacteria bacterium]|nr:enoyl-CoA hydratase [Betaproteobacteria bacterium]
MSGHVLVETKERVTRVELARLDKKNALTQEMYQALGDALAAAEADPQVRAVLVHGKPDCFCSGNDLKDFLERPPHADASPSWRFLRLIAGAAKPLVAAVGGPAVGIGTTMLLHCDLVYAAPNARFQLPFIPLGLVPEAASTLLLPLTAGYQRAAELLLLGQPFGTAKALAAGIVTEVIPEGELLEYARQAARALAALPPASVRLTKQLMKRRLAQAVAERIDEEGRAFRERLASPEAKEAMTAFFEKRKPDFSKFS